jgi:exonuclease III
MLPRILIASILCWLSAPLILPSAKAAEVINQKGHPNTLRVLVWNVWHGTNDVDQGPEKALKLIRDSKADICLLQESYDIKGDRPNFGPWAAKQLGWNAWQGKSPHLCVISRFKIKKQFFHAAWHALGVELEDDHGRKLHAFSIWIDYRHYTPYLIQKKPSAKDHDLLLCETERSGRMKQTTDILEYLGKQSLLTLDTPLLLGGDWNCPSHLDWTNGTANAFKFRRELTLPVSKTVTDAGFEDTFRMIYPDPVKHPGNTWSPLFRKKNGNPQPMDRIDRLYYKPNAKKPMLKPVRAKVYPEELEDNAIPVRERKFPSDHAAVLIEFQWQDTPKKSTK